MNIKFSPQILLCFLLPGFLSNCSKNAASPKADRLIGLASPVILNKGINTVLMADYFPTDLIIDSVRVDGPLGVGVELKDFQVLINCQDQGLRPLYNMLVFAEGIPYSILLKTPKTIPLAKDSGQEIMPRIWTKSFDGKDITIGVEEIQNIYAYWENYRLETEENENGFLIKIPPFAKDQKRSHIRVFACNLRIESNDLLIPLEKGKVLTTPGKLTSNDLESSIIYRLKLDLHKGGRKGFSDNKNDSLSEGYLTSISQKIQEGYFTNLGINTLSLSSIMQHANDSVDRDFGTISFTKGAPMFGTSEDLKTLISTAHSKGISVILELVVDRVHQDHSWVSEHPDWFIKDQNSKSIASNLKLDLNNPKVQERVLDSAILWMKEYDLDGFNLGSTDNIPSKFLRALKSKVKILAKDKGKNFYLLGIGFGSRTKVQNLVGSGLLDGVVDVNLFRTAQEYFTRENENPTHLTQALQASLGTFGSHHLMQNISGSFSNHQFENSVLWHVFNMTIPGIPAVVQGDELDIGANKNPDSTNVKLTTLLSELTNLRIQHMALIYGDLTVLSDSNLIAFKRKYFDDEVTVFINSSEKKVDYKMANGKMISVEPYGYKILVEGGD